MTPILSSNLIVTLILSVALTLTLTLRSGMGVHVKWPDYPSYIPCAITHRPLYSQQFHNISAPGNIPSAATTPVHRHISLVLLSTCKAGQSGKPHPIVYDENCQTFSCIFKTVAGRIYTLRVTDAAFTPDTRSPDTSCITCIRATSCSSGILVDGYMYLV